MKKSKLPAPTSPVRPPSGQTPKAPVLEKSKSDLTNSGTPRKLSAPATSEKSGSKPLKKTYLSKSQDNLASTLRKKAAAAALASPGQSMFGGKGAGGNKENLNAKDRPHTPVKFKTPKGGVPTPIRKANSAQGIDSVGTPIKKARSAQNINKVPVAQPSTENKSSNAVKRASSTQNISKDRNGRIVRVATPQANIMAYNAELLANFEKEKKTLERRISELQQIAELRKTDVERLKFETKNLKEQIPTHNVQEELDMLRSENRLLKDKLKELGISVEHITDTEKLSMLRKASSSPLDNQLEGAVGGDSNLSTRLKYSGLLGTDDLTTMDTELGLSVGDLSCITPEHPSSLSLDNCNWDKQSNKSSDAMSEVSVANLQDRILQMEENHYSTSEELQATLQELADLQDTVNDLTMENERLADEKQVLLESLCAQTEKLENCRIQIEHLKALLVSESEGGDRSENERQLVGLLKSAQEEREEFILKQVELCNALHTYENEQKELHDIITALRDKIHLLEMKNESLMADKRGHEVQLTEVKEQASKDHIELQRYKTLLENEKSKVAELEQYRKAVDKSDLEALLDNARQEKDKVEAKLANVQEEVAHSQNEVVKLKEQIGSLEEELKVTKNNTKKEVSDLEYKLERKEGEKIEHQQEIDTLRDHIDQLQLDCDRYLEEKKSHSSKMSEVQAELATSKQRLAELESEVRDARSKYSEEQEEWRQFQQDLQTAVVIANDIKTETQEDMEKLQGENAMLKEKAEGLSAEVLNLQQELEKLREQRNLDSSRSEWRGRVISTVDRELQALRHGRKNSEPRGGNQQNLSVKTLIASIEHQVKGVPSPPASPSVTSQDLDGSRRNSVDSTISISSAQSDSPGKPLERGRNVPGELHLKPVLKRTSEPKEARPPLAHRHTIGTISNIYEKAPPPVTDDAKMSSPSGGKSEVDGKKPLTSILANKSSVRRTSVTEPDKLGKSPRDQSDPLAGLVKQTGGSKRNALLKWCQNKTQNYSGIDITNFSSSWNDGLAFCALLHSYVPDRIPYQDLLKGGDKKKNFMVAFKAAEQSGIPCSLLQNSLNINDMACIERPDWQAVMGYVTNIYKHFEVDKLT